MSVDGWRELEREATDVKRRLLEDAKLFKRRLK
jgi:hypothetical protein